MKPLKRCLLLMPLALTACSHQNDYSPAPDATGEQIFTQVCSDCHQSDVDGIIYILKKEQANTDYIRQQIQQGSFMMPKFPNMSDEAIKKVSQFVLAHSKTQ